jgi:hypothetical protein
MPLFVDNIPRYIVPPDETVDHISGPDPDTDQVNIYPGVGLVPIKNQMGGNVELWTPAGTVSQGNAYVLRVGTDSATPIRTFLGSAATYPNNNRPAFSYRYIAPSGRAIVVLCRMSVGDYQNVSPDRTSRIRFRCRFSLGSACNIRAAMYTLNSSWNITGGGYPAQAQSLPAGLSQFDQTFAWSPDEGAVYAVGIATDRVLTSAERVNANALGTFQILTSWNVSRDIGGNWERFQALGPYPY